MVGLANMRTEHAGERVAPGLRQSEECERVRLGTTTLELYVNLISFELAVVKTKVTHKL